MSLLVAALLPVALAAPSLPSQTVHDLCPNSEGGIAYMLDGASLEWGSTSLTCDGEFSCSFSLPSGAPHTVRTEGEVSIEVGCGGVSRLGLACAHRTCVPDSLTIADSGADHRGYFPYWAPEASGAARDFRAVVRGAPEELLRHPEPVIAEIGMLDGRLRDTLRGCSELQCRLEDRDVGWLAAADMAGRLSSQVIAVTGVMPSGGAIVGMR